MKAERGHAYQAHPTACIDAPCWIGAATKIWHFCHLMPDCRVGAGCVLGQNVFVGRGVQVGDGVKIQNNVSLYEGTVVEDEVFLGPSCVLTNVRNPRAAYSRAQSGTPFDKTLLRRGCTIGANATVVCGIEVGAHAFVAAGSTVTRDVPPYALVQGVPARQTGWVGEHGYRLQEQAHNVWTCPHSGRRYVLTRGRLHAKEEANPIRDAETPLA